jgi:hypothetical protein
MEVRGRGMVVAARDGHYDWPTGEENQSVVQLAQAHGESGLASEARGDSSATSARLLSSRNTRH